MSTSSTPITIRAANKQDVPAIAGLLAELSRAEGRRATVDKAQLMKGLFGENRVVDLRALVVEAEGVVVAATLYYPGYDVLTTTHGYHLADFIVGQASRHHGIGWRLFVALAAENLAQGGAWISLTVLQANRPAAAFYSALGMQQVPVDFYAMGPAALAALVQPH